MSSVKTGMKDPSTSAEAVPAEEQPSVQNLPINRETLPEILDALRREVDQLSSTEKSRLRKAWQTGGMRHSMVGDVFYPLLKRTHPGLCTGRYLKQMERVIAMLLCTYHREKGKKLGEVLTGLKPKRVEFMLRQESPRDLRLLFQALRQLKCPNIDTHDLALSLFYWGPRQKERIKEQYYMAL